MAAVNCYKVHYHGEVSGKKVTDDRYAYVQATASDFNSLRSVLSSNTKLPPGTLVITSVANVGPDLTASGVLA